MLKRKRRDFLKLSALSAGFLGLSPALSYSKDKVEEKLNALAGTKGYHEGYPSRLSLARDDHGHEWLDEKEYKNMWDKYQHPVWTELKEEIKANGGHGGMDFVLFYRMIDNLNKGLPMDMDVYDGADWSVIVPLSKISIELGSVPVRFPDFTRNKWKGERELGIMKY